MPIVRFQVDHIYFRLHIDTANIPIKFKCRFFAQLKSSSTITNPKTLCQSKTHYRATNSLIKFDHNDIMQFDSYMVYDNDLNKYKRKQMQLIINLISDNRSDETKLVGRVKIDLNEFMIDNQGQTQQVTKQLQNCSVNKPQVAKITYTLQLLRQQKINQQTLTIQQKQAISQQIQKSLFVDTTQYNEFIKCLWGKDYNVANQSMSKLNKSILLNTSQFSNSSKGKIASEKQQMKSIIGSKKQVTTQEKTQQDKDIKQSQKSQSQKSTQQKKQPIHNNNNTSSQNISSIVKMVKINQNQQQSMKQQSTKKIEQEQSWRTIKRQSPQKQKSRGLINSSKKLIRVLSTQQQPSQSLTPQLFQQQQQYIQSLQQQLQQSQQIIQQYKLQLQLIKQQAQRLQGQRSKNVSFMQQSRTRGQQTQRVTLQQLNTKNRVIDQINVQKQFLRNQIQQYKKVIQQKQQIIRTKDNTIKQLQQQTHLLHQQFEQKMMQQDQVYDSLHQRILQQSQVQTLLKQQLKQVNKHLQQMINKVQEKDNQMSSRNEQNKLLQSKNDKLTSQINTLQQKLIDKNTQSQSSQLLNQKDHLISQLQQQLAQKQQQINNLLSLLQQQRSTITQVEIKLNQYELIINEKDTLLTLSKQSIKKEQQKLSKLQQLYNKVQQQHHALQQKYKLLQKEKYLLSQQLTTINLNTLSLQKQVQSKTSSLQTQLQQLTYTYAQSQNKISQLKFALQSYQQALKQQQTKNKQKLQLMNKKLQMFTKKQLLLRQSLDLLQQQSTKIKNYVQEKQQKLKDYEDIIIYKDQQIVQKTDRLCYLQRKLRMNQNQIQELKLQLKMAQAMVSNGRDDHSLGEVEEELRTRIFVLNQANNQLLEKHKQLMQRFQQKEHTVYQLTKQTALIDPLRRRITIFQDQTHKYQQKIKQLNQTINQLKNSCNEKQTQLTQQKQQLQHVYTQMEQLQLQMKALEDQKILIYGQLQQRQLQAVNLTGEVEQKREDVKILQKEVSQLSNRLQNMGKLLQRRQGIEQQLSDKLNLIGHNKIIAENLSLKDNQSTIKNLQSQIVSYKQLQQFKANQIITLQEEIASLNKQNQKLTAQLTGQTKTTNKSHLSSQSINISFKSHQNNTLKQACDQLQKLIDKRIQNRETQNLIQILINNSEMYAPSQSHATNQQATFYNRQKNILQQKSRILSREVQKIKSLIFKKAELPYKDKTEIIQLLKPCENITNELIKCVQLLTKENDSQITQEI